MSLNHRVLSLVFASTFAFSLLSPAFSLEKDTEKIPPSADANTEFTPLVLPEDAKARGISLSGEAKLYRTEQGKYQLGCGCVLVHTEEPIYISTCRARIFARTGATIVVGAKKDATRILNLSDRKHDSVRVLFGNNHISLNPGEELAVVSNKASSDDKASTEYVIRFRNAQPLVVSPEYKAVLFEFSLADAMKRCLIFKQLRESPNEEDHLLLGEIIKTAAAVNTMFAKSREKYTHGGQTATQIAKTKKDKASKQVASNNKKKKEPARIAALNESTEDRN